ncbi:SET domain-containing protein [Rhizobiaceae sp. 2RAB30]
MLLVDVYIAPSPIQGIGVFSKGAIPKGSLVWQLDERFDRLIPVELYESQTGPVKSYLDRYCYPRRSDPNYVVFEADDARYMNHSDGPNCDFSHGDVAHALRDIAAGEELTCDYNVFFTDGFEFLGDR